LIYGAGVCLGCYNFTAPSRGHALGRCGACRREQPLKTGYCRLCWCQARYERDCATDLDARAKMVMAPHLPQVRHHQLFLAGMTTRTAPPRRIERRRGEKGRPRKPAPPVAARPVERWVQPALFEVDRREYRAQAVDLRTGPAPDNPYLAWALHLAHATGEARGWSAVSRRAMQRTLVELLATHQAGEMVRASHARPVALSHCISVIHVLDLLERMDVLEDDLPTSFDMWIEARTGELAPAIGADALAWARHLRYGTPRSEPRAPATAYGYLAAILPALAEWSTRYHHLREVTAEDVAGFHGRLTGHRRGMALSALRSLFRWAKTTRRIFANPARGLRGSYKSQAIWQPLNQLTIDEAVAACATPQSRLYLALAAIHGARPGHIRALRFEDLDLPARRITIGSIQRPLDEVTYRVLLAYLEHRRARYPGTANPHVLVSIQTALGLGTVSHTFILDLRQTNADHEQLRIDRRLDEALASGGDPAHLLAVFGGSEGTAVRYANNARLLLQTDQETLRAFARSSGNLPVGEPGVS
jgi:integrase